jgi:hypothetical protein
MRCTQLRFKGQRGPPGDAAGLGQELLGDAADHRVADVVAVLVVDRLG